LANAVKKSLWKKRFGGTAHASHAQDDNRRSTLVRVCNSVLMVLLPMILLLIVAVGLLYVRLLNGPISLSFLKEPIEQSISAELPGFTIKIGQSVVALRGQSLELRLTNIRLDDRTGKPVAIAPLAAVEVSRRAFLGGVISPSRIVLIEPRLLVFYTPDDGISLTIDALRNERAASDTPPQFRPSFVSETSQRSGVPPQQISSAHAQAAGRIDLAQTIADLAQRARKRDNATSYLDRIGLRNATVIVDSGGTRTALRVPTANFNLAHSDLRSVLSGNISVASKRGTWRLGLRVEEAQDKNQVRLSAAVKNIYPQAIADAMPEFNALDQLQFPISAQADYILSSQGQVLAGTFDVVLGAGEVRMPWSDVEPPSLSSGRVRLIYRRGQNHIKIDTATLNWEKSRVTLNGLLKQRQLSPSVSAWDFEFQAKDGQLATTGNGSFVNIKHLTANGTLLPAQGIVNLDQTIIKAGDGSLVMDGVVYTGRSPGFSLSGRFSPMSAQNALAYWPRYLGSDARQWVVENVLAGQIQGGTFDARLRTPSELSTDTKNDYALKINAQLADMRVNVSKDLPTAYASQATIDFKDQKLTVRVPQSTFIVGDEIASNGQAMLISDLTFETTDIYAEEIDGHTNFKVNSSVRKSLDIVSKLDTSGAKTLTDLRNRFSGKVKGQFKIVIPIIRRGPLPPPKVRGQLRIVDGRAQDIWKTLDVDGSNILLDIAENDIAAQGDMLIKGVPVKIGWRKNLRDTRQASPLTLSATLDDADRNALGLEINHLVKGPIGISASMVGGDMTGKASKQPLHLRIDLTKAAMDIDSLAWTKPIGREAFVDFDVVAQKGGGQSLSNLRIHGENIAAEGKAFINAKGELSAFDISDFAVDIVTRLRIKGELRKGNIWRVSVRGTAFEGRNFFRALFSTQNKKSSTAATINPGLDLDVRINNVLGFWDTTLKNLRLDLSKRNGYMTALSAYGKFNNGQHLRAVLRNQDNARQLVATSNDAGNAFKLVGFYPNTRGGDLTSIIDLDSTKFGVRRGLLDVRRFNVLGDQIVSEVLSTRQKRQRRNKDAKREMIQFDWMRVPFVVGGGRFVVRDAELRGPLLGVVLCGKADFEKRQMQVAGTYIPLQGLSAAVGSIPGIGNLLAGQRGEGVIGINFEVLGSMQQPKVLVNPLSAVTPGIFREVFQVACPDSKFILGKNAAKRSPVKQPKIDEGWTSQTFKPSN